MTSNAADAILAMPPAKQGSSHKRQLRLQIARFASLKPTFSAKLLSLCFTLVAVLSLYVGWTFRIHENISAEEGIGYALGIIGGTLMVFLLLYPLRKKARFMRKAGPVTWWFRTHMAFGVIGPITVLYHSNFQLGSLNSNIALLFMLLVACSGLVGRYLYTSIHYSLYGRKANLAELKKDTGLLNMLLSPSATIEPKVKLHMDLIQNKALSQPKGVAHSIWKVLAISVSSRWHGLFLRYYLVRATALLSMTNQWSAEQKKRQYKKAKFDLKTYLAMSRKIAQFSFYERLFSLWHVLHFSLFLMMLITGIIHVIAVHVY